LLIRTDKLNIDQVCWGSNKIRVRCISNSDKIQDIILRYNEFQVDPKGLERLLCELFLFYLNQKFCVFITQSCQLLMKENVNCHFSKQYWKYSNFSLWFMDAMCGRTKNKFLLGWLINPFVERMLITSQVIYGLACLKHVYWLEFFIFIN